MKRSDSHNYFLSNTPSVSVDTSALSYKVTTAALSGLSWLSFYLMFFFFFQIIEKSIFKLSEVSKIVANSAETTADDFLVIIDTLETATANKDVLTLNARVKLIF